MAAKSGDRNMVETLVMKEADIIYITDHNEVIMEFVPAIGHTNEFPVSGMQRHMQPSPTGFTLLHLPEICPFQANTLPIGLFSGVNAGYRASSDDAFSKLLV